MKNVLNVDGFDAVIAYDPDVNQFRGEFVGLNGGASFYASDIEGLKREAKESLRVFLEVCAEEGIEPRKSYSGRFNVRLSPQMHAAAAKAAQAQSVSLNDWVVKAIEMAV